MQPFYIFSGYDDRQSFGFNVFAHSVWRLSKGRVDVIPLRHKTLRDKGLFDRPWTTTPDGQMVDVRDGKPFSTQFSHSRFIVPFLARRLGIETPVVFLDGNDFLCLDDPTPLFTCLKASSPVAVVKHDYAPTTEKKMDGMLQQAYPKKNWSSLMLFDTMNSKLNVLTPNVVNNSDGSYLHQFKWLEEHDIGSLPNKWNYLVGEGSYRDMEPPKMLHFTKGLPLHRGYEQGPYAWLWQNEAAAARDWIPTPSINLETAL